MAPEGLQEPLRALRLRNRIRPGGAGASDRALRRPSTTDRALSRLPTTGRLAPPVEGRSEYFSIPPLTGVRLHALHWGEESRSKLVLLHGGGANAHWWDHLAPSLADRFHVIALDFRGHGDSDHPEELEVGAFNRDLDALLEYLGIREVVLVGHSMGAHVALDHAARDPATRAVVLIDAARGAARRTRRTARLALLFRRSYPTREEAIARFRFHPPARAASDALRESIARDSVRQESDGRFSFKFDPRWFSIPPRTAPDLSKVRCPALILRGGESELLVHEAAEAFRDELPDARLVEIEGAGHHLQLDRPAEVLKELRSFLEGCSPSD